MRTGAHATAHYSVVTVTSTAIPGRRPHEVDADSFPRFVPLAAFSAIAFWLVWKQGGKGGQPTTG